MNVFFITIFLLGFLITPIFVLAMCRSAGMADRRLQQMRSPREQNLTGNHAPASTESMDLSKEKTRPVFRQVPLSTK